MKPPKSNGAPKTLAPIGAHPARLSQIIILGSQSNPSFPNSAPSLKIKLIFELVKTNHVFNQEKGPQPFQVSIKESFSFSEKANFRKHIESWLGKPLTETTIEKFDMVKFLQKFPCLVIVTHVPKKNDPETKYEKIASIIPYEGEKLPGLRTPTFVFSMDSSSPCSYNGEEISITEAFKYLNSWEQKDVEASPEWKSLIAKGGASASKVDNGGSGLDDNEDAPY